MKNLLTGSVQRLSWSVYRRLDTGGDCAGVQTRNAAWSPDGRGVAFTSEGKTLIPGVGPRQGLYYTTLKSGAVTLLSATARGKPIMGDAETVTWSPNGKRIVFYAWGRNLPPRDSVVHVYVKTLR